MVHNAAGAPGTGIEMGGDFITARQPAKSRTIKPIRSLVVGTLMHDVGFITYYSIFFFLPIYLPLMFCVRVFLNRKIIDSLHAGSSNSELLPCLLSVYDSIAAARKLEESDAPLPLSLSEKETEPRADVTLGGEKSSIFAADDRSTTQRSRDRASNPSSYVGNLSSKMDENFSSCDRPNSCTSTTSVSSQWSG